MLSQYSNQVRSVLNRLSKGNDRFVDNPQYQEERKETENTQNPCFVVVSCSDSRVSVPLIFDQPYIGRMFEIKTAGQALASTDLESIKYALEQLSDNIKILIVLGHTRCGAVEATVKSLQDTEKGKAIRLGYPSIIRNIAPSAFKVIDRTKSVSESKIARKTEIQNAIDKAAEIEFLLDGKVPVVPALYNITTGKVRWLERE